MFAVYNNGSVGFRSTVDNLYSLKSLDAPDGARLKPDDDTLFQDYTNYKKKDNHKDDSKEKALDTYKKIANLDTTEKVYHVSEIMTTDCISLTNDVTLENAYYSLKENMLSQIPIITDDKKILGMINKKTILNLVVEDIDNAKEIMDRKISDIYLPELITTDPITDIRRVAKVMLDFKLDAIPVVDENHFLLGIVSKTDIIKAVATIPKFELWY